jgi:hypothetical protein
MTRAELGDCLYCFMGEELIHFKVTEYDFHNDARRVVGEDDCNQYTFYIADCYRTKEDAIAGMLEALRDITDCDCGEDESQINYLYGSIPNCS